MEIMVCLVVMSVVVIGASGLLLQSGRLARNSAYMAHASVLASELAGILRGRLRAGPKTFPDWAGKLDFSLGQGPSGGSISDCRAQACNAEQALRFELSDWSDRAGSALPAARLVVCRDPAPWNAAASRFEWACTNQNGAPLLLKLGWKASHEAQSSSVPLLVMAID